MDRVGRNLTISWKNTKGCYGWGFAAIHWLMAVLILVVLGLGMWMVTLDYYHPWYVFPSLAGLKYLRHLTGLCLWIIWKHRPAGCIAGWLMLCWG